MDYERETKSYYQNDAKASAYFHWYTSARGLNGLRFRYIARRERQVVHALAKKVPHSKVIDVPAGTGKMAKVFKSIGSEVVACDVSSNMLSIAKRIYEREGVPSRFQVLDLERAAQDISDRFDLVVCVRLMHRVPKDVRDRMLRQISLLAPYAIVSFAVDSAYEAVRGRLRRAIMSRGSDDDSMHTAVRQTWPSQPDLEGSLRDMFDICECRRVSRALSSEVMYLLRSRGFSS